jgi:methylase of polypeptide subunit release factors
MSTPAGKTPAAVDIGTFGPGFFSLEPWTDDPSAVVALQTAMHSAGYTVDGVHDLLGPAAAAALGRNETTPAFLALTRAAATTPLTTMVRLWTLQGSVRFADAESAFGFALAALVDSGMLLVTADGVVAAVDVRPYGDESHDGWVVSDMTPGLDGAVVRLGEEYVLGVNDAATTLAGLTVRRHVARALDLGTGSGIQTLHLCEHADTVVGTDVNERALSMAQLSASLNELEVDWRLGSLLEPVAGESFDLVVSNPPFVVSPGSVDVSALTYRDSGSIGDAMVRGLVTGLPSILAPGGVAQLLANWAHVEGEDWHDRLRSWLSAAEVDVDAWIVQRELLDPAAYVELWLKDAGVHGGPDYAERYRSWLAWFEAERITAVGMGWIALHRPVDPDAGAVNVRVEELNGPVTQPLGDAVGRWVDAVDWLREHAATDDDLRDAYLVAADDVVAEQWSRPGATDPEHLVLRQQGTTQRGIEVDTALAGFVGACDGDLSAGQIVDALAELLQLSRERAATLQAEVLASARELLVSGLLRPA